MATDKDPTPMEALQAAAAQLNTISMPDDSAKPSYDVLADAVVWDDETTDEIPIHAIWALRFLRAYRTGLMLGTPDSKYEKYWLFGLEHFPNWNGFSGQRRIITDEIRQILRRGRTNIRLCIREMEKHAEEPNGDQ